MKSKNCYSDEITDIMSSKPSLIILRGGMIIFVSLILFLLCCNYIKYPRVIMADIISISPDNIDVISNHSNINNIVMYITSPSKNIDNNIIGQSISIKFTDYQCLDNNIFTGIIKSCRLQQITTELKYKDMYIIGVVLPSTLNRHQNINILLHNIPTGQCAITVSDRSLLMQLISPILNNV